MSDKSAEADEGRPLERVTLDLPSDQTEELRRIKHEAGLPMVSVVSAALRVGLDRSRDTILAVARRLAAARRTEKR